LDILRVWRISFVGRDALHRPWATKNAKKLPTHGEPSVGLYPMVVAVHKLHESSIAQFAGETLVQIKEGWRVPVML